VNLFTLQILCLRQIRRRIKMEGYYVFLRQLWGNGAHCFCDNGYNRPEPYPALKIIAVPRYAPDIP
jgi:hypothetical protein